MYRKLRIKIALSSIAVLLALFLGTIAIVYATSYRETMRAEQEMLSRYAEAYWKNGNPEESVLLPPVLTIHLSSQSFSLCRTAVTVPVKVCSGFVPPNT